MGDYTDVKTTLADLSASLGIGFTGEGWYCPERDGKLVYLVYRRAADEWAAVAFHGGDPRNDMDRLLRLPSYPTHYRR